MRKFYLNCRATVLLLVGLRVKAPQPCGVIQECRKMLDRPSPSPRQRVVTLVQQILQQNARDQRVVAVDAELTAIGLTSIDMVNLMLAVEAEFDVMIPPVDITPENFRSVATIERLMRKLGVDGAA
jgi:acyl carrier protein